MLDSQIDEAFNKNVKFTDKFCYWEATCKKGLWSITAITKERCMKEAKHYFLQYYMDGEYDDTYERFRRAF